MLRALVFLFEIVPVFLVLVSVRILTKLDRMVVDLVSTQHEKARQILSDNIGKLHELAKYLYEHETITGEEFMNILNAKPEIPVIEA